MKRLLTVSVIALFCSSTLLTPVFAKPWRGITPLVSTRSQVEHVLGPPASFSNHWGTYYIETDSVSILYSNGKPCGAGANSRWKLPKGRVVSITVSPREIVPLSSLKLDELKYKKAADPHIRTAVHYSNFEEGESITVVNGEVSTIFYTADLTTNYPMCPKKDEEPSPPPAPIFDSYGNLDPIDEASRLDNFAIALSQMPGSTGYIYTYCGDEFTPAKARTRAEAAKNYVTTRGVDPSRLIVVYNGRRTDFTINLYITPDAP